MFLPVAAVLGGAVVTSKVLEVCASTFYVPHNGLLCDMWDDILGFRCRLFAVGRRIVRNDMPTFRSPLKNIVQKDRL